MLEAAEADLALEAGFVHVIARQAFPEIGRQVRRREQTVFRASRWRRRSCRALPDAPAPPKLRDRVRGWDVEFESGLLQRGVSNEPCGCRGCRTRVPPHLSPGAACDLLVAVGLPHHRLRRCSLHRKAVGEGPVTPSDRGGALAIGMMSPCG
jgi:hypothetical protein